jgi:hypothetical protein
MSDIVPLDLYIDSITQTTCTVTSDQNIIFSGIWEITYKTIDPVLEPIETKITGEFNDIDEFYRTIFNLQPEMNYLVHVKIYADDKTYVSDELEFQTLAFHGPLDTMYMNSNNDIFFLLSPYKGDDPLPPDASYYIAYFQGTIPKQLIFHRVNGSLYILPDKSLLDKNKQLEVLAFIRYGYEIDDNYLIEDVQANFGGVITLDNVPQTNSSAYSYRPNTRRGVLTEDSFFLNL